MSLPDHPCVVNVLDSLRSAGPKGLRASFLVESIEKVQPIPPAIVVLRQLVEAGCVAAMPAPIRMDSVLMLTDEGEAQLAAARTAGAWLCQGVTASERRALTETGILRFLKAIERGEVTLIPELDPNDVYAGVVSYGASNGWRLAVFNDCNVWDYIEWIEAGAERVTYEDINREMPEVERYEPSRELAELAYKIPRITTRRAPDRKNLDADARAFAQLQEVLENRRRLRLDGTSSKMLCIMLGGGNTDAVITPERFVVHFGVQKQRLPSQYYRRLAPRVMSELLERASTTAISAPLVIGLPAGDMPRVRGAFPAWSYEPKLIWIVPADACVKVIVRPSPESWRVPYVQTVPADGPLALRELPDWVPEEPAYEEFSAALPCPRCGNASTRYRSVRSALICAKCSRSFEFTK